MTEEVVVFSQDALQELLNFESDSGVVSLYLGADLSQPNKEESMRLTARGLLKQVEAQHNGATARIDQFLTQEHFWTEPGLAVFSCPEKDFFRSFAVQAPFRNRIRTGRKPYVKPLAHLLDFYAHYGVILIDRVGARFFSYHLGNLLDSAGTMGEEVHKLKVGRGSSATGMRGGVGGGSREEEVAQRNLRQAAEEVTHFFEQHDIRRLFIGGTTENVAQFREMLPKRLQSRIAGTFAMSMDAPEHQVRDVALNLLQEANAEREEKLVESMITTAAKGGNAVTGLAPTLKAVSEGRVQTLIMSDGFRAPGLRHVSSGLISTMNGGEQRDDGWHQVQDVVEAAVERTMSYGGHVEVISENPTLNSAGCIGALLRY
jgi:peptide subunit release factor 1 (eRF1)